MATYYPHHVEDYLNGKGNLRKAKGYYSAIYEGAKGPSLIKKELESTKRFLTNSFAIDVQADTIGDTSANLIKRVAALRDHLESLLK